MRDNDEDAQSAFRKLDPNDQLALLVAEMLRLLCVDNDLSLIEARKAVASVMGGLYPHVAFDRMPVSARLQ